MTERKQVDREGAGAAETSHIAADPAPARRRSPTTQPDDAAQRRRQTAARKQEAVLRVLRGRRHFCGWLAVSTRRRALSAFGGRCSWETGASGPKQRAGEQAARPV